MRVKLLANAVISILIISFSNTSYAAMPVCNRADTTILVSVGIEDSTGKKSTQGWWKIYLGFCGEPVNIDGYEGNYFLDSRSHPILVNAKNRFLWGEQQGLCVKEGDFEILDVLNCPKDSYIATFNRFQASWKNLNTINIFNPAKEYQDRTSNRIAGVQRMLTILGYDLEVNGNMDLDTQIALANLSRKYPLVENNLQKVMMQLDQIILKQALSEKYLSTNLSL